MRVTWVFLILSVLLATTLSQDSAESEETATPKKVLRKYRVRRPAPQISGESETPATPPVKPERPRVRRIRVKQAKPAAVAATPVVIEATPQNLLSSRYGSTNPIPNIPQQVVYEEQQVVDPVRVVPNYRQAISSGTRNALLANVNLRDRDHEDNKKPTVGTTRNYSHINEDGSFTFGYEGEDGSFKEETRGTDCVVRGKYGYVDPAGVRREFAYVSGNPCDPNDPNRGENQDDEEDDEDSIAPAKAGIRQRIPVERRPVINANVQQNLEQTVEQPEDPVYRPVLRRVRPLAQPQIQARQPDALEATTFRPRIRITQAPPQIQPTSAVPEAVIRSFPQFKSPIATLSPRPLPEPNQDLSADRGNRAFNFQQELQEIAGPIQLQNIQQTPEAAQQPQIQYQVPQPFRQPVQQHQSSIHGFPQRQHFGSQATSIFQHQQQQPDTAQLQARQVEQKPGQQSNFGRYRTELVYDPATGQYTNIVVQEAPKSNEEFTLTQRLRAFADPQTQQVQFQQYEQPQLQYFGQPQYHQYQQPIGYHHSQSPHAAASQTIMNLHSDAQQYTNSAASGQIDAFLRTLNLS